MFNIPGLKKQIQAVVGKYHDLVAEGERLRQQRDEIKAAPCSREDVLAAICRLIDARAQQYPARLQERIEDMGLAHNLDDVYRLSSDLDKRGAAIGLLAAVQHTSVAPAWRHVEEAMYFMFADQLKAAVERALNAMEWPAGSISLGKRTERLKELDDQIAAIEKQQSELLRDANVMGIRLEV